MKTISKIKRYICRLDKNVMFTTRQLLSLGLRSAVDQATYKLVKDGIIVRITYGVFVKAGSDLSRITADDLARVKAKAFKRQIVEHPNDAGKRLGIAGHGNKGPTYATRARSSSFMMYTLGIRIYFKAVSARKFKLAGSFLGDILRALWNLKQSGCDRKAISQARMMLKRSDKANLPAFAAMIPAWLQEHFTFAWR